MDKENLPSRPKFSVRDPRGKAPKPRHHNPGTRYIPVEKRVNVLSTICVVPPKIDTVNDPRVRPSTTKPNKESQYHLRPAMPEAVVCTQATQWETPRRLDEEPETIIAKPLIPEPRTFYGGSFDVVPIGEAYSPVPLYINRDIPWQLRVIDTPTRRHVYYDRDDSTDPRRRILKVELTRLPNATYCPREIRIHLQPAIRDLRVHLTQMRLNRGDAQKTEEPEPESDH